MIYKIYGTMIFDSCEYIFCMSELLKKKKKTKGGNNKKVGIGSRRN